jgi:acyl carrier protein
MGLANRLGLGEFRESDPALHRHFEAIAPSTSTPIEELIPCSRITISLELVSRTLQNLPFVRDVLLWNNLDGTLAAFISLSPTAKSIPAIDELEFLSLPGYALPNPIYFIHGPLLKDHTGEYDFRRMENESLNAKTMTEHQLLVRKIVAEVLDIDPAPMTAYSDFFLMGGTSLLLGQLCYRLRRQTGINIEIADLFTESTICGIASMIEEKENKGIKRQLTDVGNGTNAEIDASSAAALFTEHLYEQDAEYHRTKRSRGQNHPLCLVVQAIPFIFFYPSKRALTCK